MNVYKRIEEKCRPSKRLCQEKLICHESNSVASYQCDECGTFQCEPCTAFLHREGERFSSHVFVRLKVYSEDELCQIRRKGNKLSCSPTNVADVKCEQCGIIFCYVCFEKFHKGLLRNHHKVELVNYVDNKDVSQEEDDIVDLKHSNFSDDDESLKFVSCSQLDQTSVTNFNLSSEPKTDFQNTTLKMHQNNSIPDLCLDSLERDLSSNIEDELAESMIEDNIASFMLIDEEEKLQVSSADTFLQQLGCEKDNELVKVVSIFGNTGDGKSHTMNHTFFSGKEVFKTSPNPSSCTIGVWAAFDPSSNVIAIDTEGLLGTSVNQNQRSRLLLKVLAVSDIVIYRTRAERLHNDMFQFLCDASVAYNKYFAEELKNAAQRCKKNIEELTPSVIVFHETVNTKIIGLEDRSKVPESFLWDRFNQMDCSMMFKDLYYVGVQTKKGPTDFIPFKKKVLSKLKDKTIRASRKPEVVFETLKSLNEKFSSDVEKPVYGTFPDQVFSCSMKCLSCGASCKQSTNHCVESEPHSAEKNCIFQHQYGNKVYLCKKCKLGGRENFVVPKTSESQDSTFFGFAKYVWSGEVLECPHCGVIYRSRANWYGNKEMEMVVSVETRHVWPDGYLMLNGTQNAARKVVDGIHYLSEQISMIGAKPTKMLSDWMTDKIAPDYWVPNFAITNCESCQVKLETEQKHHCRACGKGFCDDCSSQKRPVPERGWGDDVPVRVCNNCYAEGNQMTDSNSSTGSNSQVTVRKMGEAMSSVFGMAASSFHYPMEMIKNTSRPSYWVADSDIKDCYICHNEFGPKLKIHHCRACGQGVCDSCSPEKRKVPIRGWDYPVRVCKNCFCKTDRL